MAADTIPPGEPDGSLPIKGGIAVPRRELTFKATRSSGPGGQHVNKTSSRVELTWSPGTSQALSPELRARALQRLANRLDGRGVLHLVSDRTRSQFQNREDVTERFVEVLRAALTLPRIRRPTKASKGVKERRLDAKKRHGAKKADRRRKDHD